MIFEVCGTPALERIEALLAARGYRQVDGRLLASGDYRVTNIDAAPGWSDWIYEVEVIERPGHPIAEVLDRFAREGAG
ncbi:MAG: hypothetical protein H6711_10190 [Myxococcales bacterium]|nr:hypothetical protein [Myxococcales bacterium]